MEHCNYISQDETTIYIMYMGKIVNSNEYFINLARIINLQFNDSNNTKNVRFSYPIHTGAYDSIFIEAREIIF